jgi:hypothetical protein
VARGLLSRLCFNDDAAAEHPQGYLSSEPNRWCAGRACDGQPARMLAPSFCSDLGGSPAASGRAARAGLCVRQRNEVHSLQPFPFMGPNV